MRRRDLVLAVIGVGIVVFGIALYLLHGSSGGSSSTASAAAASASAAGSGGGGRHRLPGFGETQISVHADDMDHLGCVLLANTEALRDRGLMQVTDPTLGGYDGMLFTFGSDTTVEFYMRNTPMPLTVAFFDSTGEFISSADMAPCADIDGCPLFASPRPYRSALEVPQGRLGALGIGPGTTLTDESTHCT